MPAGQPLQLSSCHPTAIAATPGHAEFFRPGPEPSCQRRPGSSCAAITRIACAAAAAGPTTSATAEATWRPGHDQAIVRLAGRLTLVNIDSAHADDPDSFAQ
jgi:hypothetical protein